MQTYLKSARNGNCNYLSFLLWQVQKGQDNLIGSLLFANCCDCECKCNVSQRLKPYVWWHFPGENINKTKTADGLTEMLIHFLPAGGAFTEAEIAVLPGNGCKQISAALMNVTLLDIIGKMKWKYRNSSENSQFPSKIHSCKSSAPRFDFETCSAHVYSAVKVKAFVKSICDSQCWYCGGPPQIINVCETLEWQIGGKVLKLV